MSGIDYQGLLTKYSTQQPGEVRSTEYEREKKKEQRIKKYLETAEVFMGPDYLNIKGDQRQHAYWIIQEVPLRQLHQQLPYEHIILGICYYVKKLFNSRVRYTDYKVFKDYGLSLEQAYQILTRITSFAFNKSYLVPMLSENYKHEKLCENGGVL